MQPAGKTDANLEDNLGARPARFPRYPPEYSLRDVQSATRESAANLSNPDPAAHAQHRHDDDALAPGAGGHNRFESHALGPFCELSSHYDRDPQITFTKIISENTRRI